MEEITIVKTTRETIVLQPKDGKYQEVLDNLCNEENLKYQKQSLVSDYFSSPIKEMCEEYDVVDSYTECEVE